MRIVTTLFLAFFFISSASPAQEKKKEEVSFAKDVAPILKASCVECHNATKKKGRLDLSSYDALKKGGKNGAAFVSGDPEKSLMVEAISGKEPDMPKKKDPLKKDQVDLIAKWIKEGAKNN
jgi:mono/diheme cytochrome c family protein